MKKLIAILATAVSLLISTVLLAQNTSGNNETTPFNLVDEKPMFQGAEASKFSLWVFSQIKYPEQAFKENISGRVTLQFVICKDGKVRGTRILRSSGSELLDNEALRVISSSPEWEPGKVKGKPVDVTFTYPVVFKLNGDKKAPDANVAKAAMDTLGAEAVPFAIVDEKPTFLGQDPSPNFTKWMFSEIKYPEEAVKNKIMGRTIVQFIISKEGKVTGVRILKSSGNELLDNEAVRVISNSPDWGPGKINGKPVDVKYTFPVVFMLK